MPTRAATSGIHLIFFVQNAAEAPRRHRQTVSAGVKRERGALCLSSTAGCEGAGSWNRSPGPGGRWSGAGSQSGPGAARAVHSVGAVPVPGHCPPAGPPAMAMRGWHQRMPRPTASRAWPARAARGTMAGGAIAAVPSHPVPLPQGDCPSPFSWR